MIYVHTNESISIYLLKQRTRISLESVWVFVAFSEFTCVFFFYISLALLVFFSSYKIKLLTFIFFLHVLFSVFVWRFLILPSSCVLCT